MTIDENWCEIRSPRRHRPMLFIDRDGVLMEDGEYLADPDGVVLLPGAGAAIRRAHAAGFDVVVITNQSGIGRGYFGWPDFQAVQARLAELLLDEGAIWDMALACPYHPTGASGVFLAEHAWRKPNPGMLLHAAACLGGPLQRSIVVGDRLSDLQAGLAAGVAAMCHVLTGHGRSERSKVTEWPHPVMLLDDLRDLPPAAFGEGITSRELAR